MKAAWYQDDFYLAMQGGMLLGLPCKDRRHAARLTCRYRAGLSAPRKFSITQISVMVCPTLKTIRRPSG